MTLKNLPEKKLELRLRTKQELATVLGVSRSTLWRRMKAHDLIIERRLLTPKEQHSIAFLFGYELNFSSREFTIRNVRSGIRSFSRQDYRIKAVGDENHEFRTVWLSSKHGTELESSHPILTFDVELSNIKDIDNLKQELNNAVVNVYDENANWKDLVTISLKNVYRDSPEIKAFPNPFIDEIMIHFDRVNSSHGRLELLDIKGQILVTQEYQSEKGFNSLSLNTTQLTSGFYILRQIEGGTLVAVKKLIK